MRLRTAGGADDQVKPIRRLPTAVEEWVVAGTSLWFVFGAYLDGWAHNHLASSLETFFTPWHAVFYSGYVATLSALLVIVWANRRRTGSDWRTAIPVGYGWSLVGAAVFFVGGIGDLIWHTVFGIEVGVEALLSPTHLLLAAGMFLLTTGNLRSWWARPTAIGIPKLLEQLPMALSLAFALSALTFMTQFVHPMNMLAGIPRPQEFQQSLSIKLGVAGYLLQSSLLAGVLCFALKRARLARGVLLLTLLLNVVAMAWMADGWLFVPGAMLVALLAEYGVRNLYPLEQHVAAFRAFAFVIPAAYSATTFFALSLDTGLWWSVHTWAGCIVLSGIAGLLACYVAVPPDESAA
jgi:hypothetical protein